MYIYFVYLVIWGMEAQSCRARASGCAGSLTAVEFGCGDAAAPLVDVLNHVSNFCKDCFSIPYFRLAKGGPLSIWKPLELVCLIKGMECVHMPLWNVFGHGFHFQLKLHHVTSLYWWTQPAIFPPTEVLQNKWQLQTFPKRGHTCDTTATQVIITSVVVLCFSPFLWP